MKNCKRLLACLLCALMLVSVLPVANVFAKEYNVGDIIEYGSYPQTEVTDEELISKLNSINAEWVSYRYMNGNIEVYGDFDIGSAQVSDYMQYCDVEINKEKYRGVKFDYYRPYYTTFKIMDSGAFSNMDNNGYLLGKTYWFKWEPIEWRILDPNSGLALSESVIDSQAYNDTMYKKGIDSYGMDIWWQNSDCLIYANNYYESTIRDWLNNYFYDVAFSEIEKAAIKTTQLDNEAWDISSKYNSQKSNDKVFLLSYNDVINPTYGFSSNPAAKDESRAGYGTDYAKCQGVHAYGDDGITPSYWWLRTAGKHSYNACNIIYDNTVINDYGYVICTVDGVRPSITLNLENLCIGGHSYSEWQITKSATHIEDGIKEKKCIYCDDTITEIIEKIKEHSYEKTVTNPTCTAKGYTTYICECGDSYISDYTNKVSHSYGDWKTVEESTCLKEGSKIKTCSVCGDKVTEKIPKTNHKDENNDGVCDDCKETINTKNCSHICHKGGFLGFIWKIVNFFFKLFKVQKYHYCKCGKNHWA